MVAIARTNLCVRFLTSHLKSNPPKSCSRSVANIPLGHVTDNFRFGVTTPCIIPWPLQGDSPWESVVHEFAASRWGLLHTLLQRFAPLGRRGEASDGGSTFWTEGAGGAGLVGAEVVAALGTQAEPRYPPRPVPPAD